MLKYRVQGQWDDRSNPVLIAATSFRDVADYLAAHAADAFGCGNDLTVIVSEVPDAENFARRPRRD